MTSINNFKPVASFISRAAAVKTFFRRGAEANPQTAPSEGILSFIGEIKATYPSPTPAELTETQELLTVVDSPDYAACDLAPQPETASPAPDLAESQSEVVVLDLALEDRSTSAFFDDEDILEII